jgi:hypothetical protein
LWRALKLKADTDGDFLVERMDSAYLWMAAVLLVISTPAYCF